MPVPWQALNGAAGSRDAVHVGDAANRWQSLEIMATPGDLTGIKQRVYMPVPRPYGYTATLYAKHISGPSRVNVSLRSRTSDKVFATASIDITATEWSKYTATLKLEREEV